MTARLSCVHRPPCPGCPHLGRQGLAETTQARLFAWCASLGLASPRVEVGPATAYRVRSRLSVRAQGGGVRIGIFRAGTHDVVDVPRCLVHHPLINRVAVELQRAMARTGTSAYRETQHRGLVRALQVVVETRSQTAQVVLVLNSDAFEAGTEVAEALSRGLDDALHGLFINLNPQRTNTIMGPHTLRVLGREAVVEHLGGADVHFPPLAFGQANLSLFRRAVEDLHARVPADARVLEYYAGVGAIGLGLVERSRAYGFNEVGRGSLAGLGSALDGLTDDSRAKVFVLEGRAGEHAAACQQSDVVVVDPPRKGLDPELSAALSGTVPSGPRRILYLSCGFDALQSDVEAITGAGHYRVTEVKAYALFPYTDHVETLVVLDR